MQQAHSDAPLSLRAGDLVEVRSQEEILASLDREGRLDSLPFMPEMLRYCGKRYRVSKRADKTCDYIDGWHLRRLQNTVHLEGLRCDGEAHGGCQAACFLFWKEQWLKKVEANIVAATVLEPIGSAAHASRQARCSQNRLVDVTRILDSQGEERYVCQMTELRKFSTRLRWWDISQYWRDVISGNLHQWIGSTRRERIIGIVLSVVDLMRALLISVFNELERRTHGIRYPYVEGSLAVTPKEQLHLQPGELVQVKSRDEIVATLNPDKKNRGLLFDAEMLPYCGGIYKVLRRVERLIDERSHKMIQMKGDCIVLDGVVCTGVFHNHCPRAIYPFWREIWLKRVGDGAVDLVGREQMSCSESSTHGCSR